MTPRKAYLINLNVDEIKRGQVVLIFHYCNRKPKQKLMLSHPCTVNVFLLTVFHIDAWYRHTLKITNSCYYFLPKLSIILFCSSRLFLLLFTEIKHYFVLFFQAVLSTLNCLTWLIIIFHKALVHFSSSNLQY